jgi:hypothetical protein
MGELPRALGLLATRVVIIALVQAQMLGRFRRGLRPRSYDSVERVSQQLHIVPIGARHDHRHGNPLPLSQHTTLRALLATVRGVGARGLPSNGALVIAPSTLCQVHSNPLRAS